MGVGLTTALYNGRSSLLAREKQMNVLGNNVAHTDDPDFHRQSVVLQSSLVVKTTAGYYGTGVTAVNVIRNFNAAMERSYRKSLGDGGYYEVYSDYLEDVQNTITRNSTSPLATQIQAFADAVQKVASLPENEGERYSMLDKARLVAGEFNSHYSRLSTIRDDIADATTGGGFLSDTIDQVNNLLEEIAQLNLDIYTSESFKFRPQKDNDTRDRRDAVIKRLSELVDVSYRELGNACYEVSIGGQVVVPAQRPDERVFDTITLTMTGVGPHFTPTLTWTNAGVAANISSGKVKGALDARSYVTGHMDELWTYAESFANVLNLAQGVGFDLDGNPGADLFDATTAGQMSVLISNPRRIAASTSGDIGDGSNALNMWNQMNSPVLAIGNDTLLNHADRRTDTMAANYAFSMEMKEATSSTVTMFRDSISERTGVSMDEEMSYMLEVQRAYQASAKYVSAIDSMMQAIINMV